MPPMMAAVDAEVYVRMAPSSSALRGRVIRVTPSLLVLLERAHGAAFPERVLELPDASSLLPRSASLDAAWEAEFAAAQDRALRRWTPPIDALKTPFKNAKYDRKYSERSRRGKWLQLKQVMKHEAYDRVDLSQPTYPGIEAPPSMLPPKKYCDISGRLAKYTHPRTKMQYANAQLYAVIEHMPRHAVDAYLELRKARVRLR